jgi:hypothetical protein
MIFRIRDNYTSWSNFLDKVAEHDGIYFKHKNIDDKIDLIQQELNKYNAELCHNDNDGIFIEFPTLELYILFLLEWG